MPEIPFTQFLRPDGRTRLGSFCRPDEIADLAKKIIDAGYNFTCEMLTTGQISLAVADANGCNGGDLTTRVVRNGPEVLAAIDDMIRSTAERLEHMREDDTQTPFAFEGTDPPV